MQSYQKFEYAIGHWLQKATEHVLGCVLCRCLVFPPVQPLYTENDFFNNKSQSLSETSKIVGIGYLYLYRIQASGTPQPIHFLKADDVSYPNSGENTNTKTNTVTKTMTNTKTPRE